MATKLDDKSLTVTISLTSHLKILAFIFVYLLPSLLLLILGYSDNQSLYWYIMPSFILLIIVSPIILTGIFAYKNYYCVNKKDTLIFYDNEGLSFISNNPSCILNFTYKDIESIDVFIAYVRPKYEFKGLLCSLLASPWDEYTHAILRLKNGKELVITSLLFSARIWINLAPSKTKIHYSIYRSGSGLKHKL